MKELSLNVRDLEWKESHRHATGAMAKEFLSDKEQGITAILLKLEPGWKMSEHGHVLTEIHYVLEGEYESQGKTFSAGTFRVIPKEASHGPFSSRNGATILVLWVETPR